MLSPLHGNANFKLCYSVYESSFIPCDILCTRACYSQCSQSFDCRVVTVVCDVCLYCCGSHLCVLEPTCSDVGYCGSWYFPLGGLVVPSYLPMSCSTAIPVMVPQAYNIVLATVRLH